MSRRRTAIAAIQTVVVAVLAVVIFLTLLQPEGGEMPSGLEAPAQQGAAGANANADVRSDYVRNRSGQRGDETHQGEGRGNSSAGPPASTSTQESGPPASTGALGFGPPIAGGPVARPGSPGDADSPTGDQYADTLTRLSDDLR